ncbi:MAG TPA: ABC transporter ATP-binding protein [Candidatus Korarchaeota archaeon]|nr:ABC transporter ATP-binding protein [Candidatus Korarchaeota archaeon]
MQGKKLEVRSLCKSFGALRAVDNVDMVFKDKDISLIIGPNGSGKTTLINCISGFYKPDKGNVLYDGLNITGRPPHEIAKVGLVRTFQIAQPFQKLTVLENMLTAHSNPGENFFWSLFSKRWINKEEEAAEKAFEILCLLKLDHLWDRPSYELSGGQLKLLEIGRALMTGAKTIMMDEPAGSVNPVLAHEIFSHIRTLRDEMGLAFILIEHRLDIAMKYVDYVYAMASGKVISSGEPEEVLNDPKVIESYLG